MKKKIEVKKIIILRMKMKIQVFKTKMLKIINKINLKEKNILTMTFLKGKGKVKAKVKN